MKLLFANLLYFVCISNVLSMNIHEEFPSTIKPGAKYVFYSHGWIVEGENKKPVDHRWGVYDFPAVQQALTSQHHQLISIHRPKGTDPFIHSKELANYANKLISEGVKPQNITFIGFSRGSFITGLVSNELKNKDINFVLLAACGRLLSKKHSDLQLYGNVLSIYETTDGPQSCAKLKDRSNKISSFKEVVINTNLSHGAFYQPRMDWLLPVYKWLDKT